MEITKRIAFAANPTQVLAMMLDERFHRLVGDRQEAITQQVSVTDDRVRANRTFAAHDSIIAFVGKTLEIVEDTEWVSPTEAQMSLSISDAPVHYLGSLKLIGSGTGTEVAFDGNLSVRIPLLGPSLERKAVKVVDLALNAMHSAGAEYLATQQ